MRVRGKIFLSIFSVAIILLVALYGFQVLLIDGFYRFFKTGELKETANKIISEIETEDYEKTVDGIIVDGEVNVRIIDTSNFENLYLGGSGRVSAAYDISNFELLKLYDTALENGGEYLQYYSYDTQKEQKNSESENRYDKKDSKTDDKTEKDTDFDVADGEINKDEYLKRIKESPEIGVQFFKAPPPGFFEHRKYVDDLLYVKLVENSSGQELMVVSDVKITPLDSTIKILKMQLAAASVIALLVALAVSFFMSKYISKPIVDINKSAYELARGNFDTEFDGKGYREIEELSDTLNFTTKELGKADNFRRELVANVSHDLRTPLTMIGGYAEMMRDIPSENNEKNLNVIIDETKRLTGFVNDILDLSKIQSGIENINIEKVNLTEMLSAIKDRYNSIMGANGYKIELSGDEKDVFVHCDEAKISRALYNLIDNALNHTGTDKTVKITQKTSGEKVRVEISDSGEGIPKEELPYIWDRYYRTKESHKRAVSGSGIGLSIVKSVFEAHKLLYGVETGDRGSTFWVEFDAEKNKNAEKLKHF